MDTSRTIACGPTSAISRSHNTVEDLMNSCISLRHTAIHLELYRAFILSSRCFKTEAQIEQFFRTPDTVGYGCVEDGLAWCQIWAHPVCEKYLKALAVDACTSLFPEADTAALTLHEQSFLNDDTLMDILMARITDVMTNQEKSADAVVSPEMVRARESMITDQLKFRRDLRFLFDVTIVLLLTYAPNKLLAAAQFALPFMDDVRTHRATYQEVLPLIISYFSPTKRLRGLTHDQRVEILVEALLMRGYSLTLLAQSKELSFEADQYEASSLLAEGAPSSESVQDLLCSQKWKCVPLSALWKHTGSNVITSVYALLQRSDDTTREGLFPSVAELYTFVIEEGKAFMKVCQGKAEDLRTKNLSNYPPVDTFAITTALCNVLRLKSPYDVMLQKESMWNEVLSSDGYIPLTTVVDYISIKIESMHKSPPDDLETLLLALLQQHDMFQRFEVGTCTIPGSAFAGQLCARAIYSHSVATPRIYKNIICGHAHDVNPLNSEDIFAEPVNGDDAAEKKMMMIPQYAWVSISKFQLKVLATRHILPVYEGVNFFTAMPASAVAACRAYKERVPQEEQFDEKLRSADKELYFVEIFMHALLREDRGLAVYPSPRAGSAGDVESRRWYIFLKFAMNESGTMMICNDDDEDMAGSFRGGLPKVFLTGRCVTLGKAERLCHKWGISLTDGDDGSCVSGAYLISGDSAEEGGTQAESNSSATAAGASYGADASALWNRETRIRGTPCEFRCLFEETLRKPRLQFFSLLVVSLSSAIVPESHTWEAIAMGRGEDAVYRQVYCSSSSSRREDDAACGARDITKVFCGYPRLRSGSGDGAHNGPQSTSSTVDVHTPTTEATLQYLQKSSVGSHAPTLDVQFFKQQLSEHFADPDNHIMILSLPLIMAGGGSISNRNNDLKAFKVWVAAQGLRMSRLRDTGRETEEEEEHKSGDHSSDNANEDAAGSRDAVPAASSGGSAGGLVTARFERFQVQRLSVWSRQELMTVAGELGAADIFMHSLHTLRCALTRESENATDNYEVLEFIGDGMLDFLVMYDAALAATLSARGVLRCGPAREQVKGLDDDTGPAFLGLHEEVSNVENVSAVVGSSQMHPSVTSLTCCNRVLAELLPSTVRTHTSRYHCKGYSKMKADMLEAIIGAAYKAGAGLEGMRQLLRRVFAQLPEALERATNCGSGQYIGKTNGDVDDVLHIASPNSPKNPSEDNDSLAGKLRSAIHVCPYFFINDKNGRIVGGVHSFGASHTLIESPLKEQYLPSSATANTVNMSAHVAIQSAIRVQIKDYATHFTTGLGGMFSYRRALSFAGDAQLVYKRILALHQRGITSYVNEIFTPYTHLVCDVDGANVHAWDVLRLMHKWYTERYGSSAGLLVNDATGHSVVKGTLKESCHVHFPQVVLSIECLGAVTQSIREYIRSTCYATWAKLREDFPQPCSKHVNTKDDAVALQSSIKAAAVFAARRCSLCSARWLAEDLKKRTRACNLGRHEAERRVIGVWKFARMEDLLALSHTSTLMRLSVLRHVLGLFASDDLTDLAKLFGVHAEEGCVLRGETTGADPQLVVAQGITGRRWILPESLLVALHMVTAPDAAEEKRMASRALYGNLDLDTVIDNGPATSRKLRLYLCDKNDMKYGREYRPLQLDSMCVRRPDKCLEVVRVARLDRPQFLSMPLTRRIYALADMSQRLKHVRRDSGDGKDTEHMRDDFGIVSEVDASDECVEIIVPNPMDRIQFPVVVARGSTMRLTTQRSAQFRDVRGALYHAWQPCIDLAVDGEIDDHSGHQVSSISLFSGEEGDARCDVVRKAMGVLETLPSLEEVLRTARVADGAGFPRPLAADWPSWVNAFKVMPITAYEKELSASAKHFAASLVWAEADTCNAEVVFYCGMERLLTVTGCTSMSAALAATGKYSALSLLGRLLIPHYDYAAAELSGLNVGANVRVLPLFLGNLLLQKGQGGSRMPPPQARPVFFQGPSSTLFGS